MRSVFLKRIRENQKNLRYLYSIVKFLVHPNPTRNDIHIIPQTNVGSGFIFVLYYTI